MADFIKVRGTPKSNVVRSTFGSRAVGRLTKINLTNMHNEDSLAERDLVGDVFQALYQSDPQTLEEVPEDRRLNKKLVEWMMADSNWQKDHANTARSSGMSALTAGFMHSALMNDDTIRRVMQLQAQAEELEAKARAAEYAADQADQTAQKNAESGDIQKAHLGRSVAMSNRQNAENYRRMASSSRKSAEEKADKFMSSFLGKGLVGSVAQSAGENAQKVKDFVDAWGDGSGQGILDNQDPEEILRVFNGTNNSFSKLVARLMGRYQGIASKTIQGIKSAYTGVVSVPSTTRDIRKLFPTERMYLSAQVPACIRIGRVNRLLHGDGLLGWRPLASGKESGSVAIEVDNSGSMSGQKAAVSVAIALAVAKCVRDMGAGRQYTLGKFSGTHDPHPTVTSKDGWREHLQWASSGVRGSTDFNKALNHAMDCVEAMDDARGCDISILTDGMSDVNHPTRTRLTKMKEEKGVRLFLINVGPYVNEQLKEMCDLFISIPDPAEFDRRAEEIVRELSAAIVS